LECPRSQQLQERLGEAGKTDSPPMAYVSALVLLPLGLLWSWRLGKGTASEHDHLRSLLGTLPQRALIVADAFYQGYALYRDILASGASFLVRLSSRSRLYTADHVPWDRFRQTLVYYWPDNAQSQDQPPLCLRVVRVRGPKADVWLLTNVLDPRELNHRQIAQLYRWRWRNEGLFRYYKRMLGKVKLQSRTVKLVHREAEGSLIALQLLLALATRTRTHQGQVVVLSNMEERRVASCCVFAAASRPNCERWGRVNSRPTKPCWSASARNGGASVAKFVKYGRDVRTISRQNLRKFSRWIQRLKRN